MFKLVVLFSVLAFASASVIGPLGLGAPLGLGVPAPLGLGVAAPLAGWGAPVIGANNYRGPLSLAPWQPANIVAADGRPLDTLAVNVDRAAHLTARAVNGLHILKKRSAPLLAPVSPVARISPALGLTSVGLHGPLAAPLGAPLAAPLVGHLGSPLATPLGVSRWGIW